MPENKAVIFISDIVSTTEFPSIKLGSSPDRVRVISADDPIGHATISAMIE